MLLTTTHNNIHKYLNSFFVNTNNIIRCEASSNYTKLFFTDKKPILIAKTLRACAMAINNNNFVRIHNSHLVNKNYVQKIEVDGSVFLKDGSVCNISRRKKREVRELLCAS
jgi:two-component system, LytTR family, response regulator